MVTVHAAPSLALPGALSGASGGAFVRRSIQGRLADILVSVVDKNKGNIEPRVAELLRVLQRELREGSHVVRGVPPGERGPDWSAFCAGRVGVNAMEVEWFWLENYIYRLILSDSYLGYFKSPSPKDPFHPHKRQALDAGIASTRPLDENLPSRENFRLGLLRTLWGNQADLSLSSGSFESVAFHGTLLIDHEEKLWDCISAAKGGQFKLTYILDNCGAELLHDLVLQDFLLSHFPGCTLVVHCKSAPVFVSDAMPKDVVEHIRRMEQCGALCRVGTRLLSFLESGRLVLTSDEFYCSPLPFWEAPESLVAKYHDSIAVILKGDANYRRLLGDRWWSLSTKFDDIMSYWGGLCVMSVRTCKAPILVEVPRSTLLEEHDENWLVDGSTGCLTCYAGSA